MSEVTTWPNEKARGEGCLLPAPLWAPRVLSSRGQAGQGSAHAGGSSPAWQLPRPPSSSSRALVVMEMSEKPGSRLGLLRG